MNSPEKTSPKPDIRINLEYQEVGLFIVERYDGTLLAVAGTKEKAHSVAREIYRKDLAFNSSK